MELALKMIALPQEKTKKQEESPLAEEIREVSRLLSCNEAWFRLETDEDLPWSLDGEYAASAPAVEIVNCQRAATMLLG